jgi:hypothetical protein
VLEAQSSEANLQEKLAEFDRICFESADELQIRYKLSAFGRSLSSQPETCPALFRVQSQTLIFVSRSNKVPWAPIARELALALYPEEEPGRIAPGLKEVLAAETAEAAKTALDELGFVTLDDTTRMVPIGVTISQLGCGEAGESAPSGQVDGHAVLGEQTLTASIIDPVAAILGSGLTTTPPPAELNKSESPAGIRSQTGQSTDARGHGGAPGSSSKRNPQRPANRGRLRSYVINTDPNTEAPRDSESAKKRTVLAECGIVKVVALEQSCGRYPDVKPPFHEGYDIESRDSGGEIQRYIEVKSLSGLWDSCGVGLTSAEFKKAQELGAEYWLYIVECADQPDARIYQIQNPALRVDQFMFDHGWSQAADPGSPRT